EGSCGYATTGTTGGSPVATLAHKAQGPLCFTAWYHQFGTDISPVFFSILSDKGMCSDFYASQPEAGGRWHRVRYSEKHAGSVEIHLRIHVSNSLERGVLAVDDLTVESGECPPEPKDGSCDFDWGETCGYSFGENGTLWKLENRQEGSSLRDYSSGGMLGPENKGERSFCAIDDIRLDDCKGKRSQGDRSCDFEDGWCTWTNRHGAGTKFAWLLAGGDVKTTLARPNQDKTLGNASGSYLLLSNHEQNDGDKADLIGEILAKHFMLKQCLTFWSIVSGDEDTSLQPIFRGIVGSASKPAYIALDDITVSESDWCDILPRGADALDVGGMIHINGSALVKNGGSLRLFSPRIGRQAAACFSVWFHMFGARGVHMKLSINKTDTAEGWHWHLFPLLERVGRTATDRWYNVRRTVSSLHGRHHERDTDVDSLYLQYAKRL
ncbi:hypothetical protein V5799_025011, partial [Amblyomma americanum]